MADDAIKTTADALTFAEHRAIREGEKVAAEPPKLAATAEETTSSDHEPETAAETGAADKKSQDKKRDRTLDGRISELTAARRKAEQERDELRSKIAEFEKGSRPSTQTEAKAKPAAAETAKPATDDPKPKLSELLAKAKATDSYEDVQEAWADAVDEWRQRQRTRETQRNEAETRKTALREGWQQKLEAARGEYDDFDAVTAGDVQAQTGLVLTRPMVEFAIEHELGAHVGYWLGKNPAEFDRIKQLSPVQQVAELGAIARDIRRERGETAKPEKPKTAAVSRVAPPPRSVAGANVADPKSTADARTFAEHKRLREKR